MAQYDPNKKYSWNNDEEIVISGRDFGLYLNAFRAILSTEQASQVLLANEANKSIETTLAKYVEKDVIKEVEDVKSKEESPLKVKK